MNNSERLIRRSRGYVPAPLKTGLNVDSILATGAELSNCFGIGKGSRAYLSQHIGDLRNLETLEFFEETVQRFGKIFRIKPVLAATDMHPDYLSVKYARQLGIPVIPVQHHHAHIASCLAENGVDEKVIGIAFDGTGYGTDGNIWGGEFLVCDLTEFERHGHFEYMPVPGGDKVTEEPWRMAVSLLHMAFGDAFPDDLLLKGLPEPLMVKQISEAIRKGINCPFSSGAGRLFDGVSAITGICTHSRFHAEAPMRLESAVDRSAGGSYDINISNGIVSFRQCIRQICDDLRKKINTGTISARFHHTVVRASVEMTNAICKETGINKVALSGGSFQNKFLFESLCNELTRNGYSVITHHKIPCNDGGLALGQLVVAAGRRMNN